MTGDTATSPAGSTPSCNRSGVRSAAVVISPGSRVVSVPAPATPATNADREPARAGDVASAGVALRSWASQHTLRWGRARSGEDRTASSNSVRQQQEHPPPHDPIDHAPERLIHNRLLTAHRPRALIADQRSAGTRRMKRSRNETASGVPINSPRYIGYAERRIAALAGVCSASI